MAVPPSFPKNREVPFGCHSFDVGTLRWLLWGRRSIFLCCFGSPSNLVMCMSRVRISPNALRISDLTRFFFGLKGSWVRQRGWESTLPPLSEGGGGGVLSQPPLLCPSAHRSSLVIPVANTFSSVLRARESPPHPHRVECGGRCFGNSGGGRNGCPPSFPKNGEVPFQSHSFDVGTLWWLPWRGQIDFFCAVLVVPRIK